jgi:hexosaminidase
MKKRSVCFLFSVLPLLLPLMFADNLAGPGPVKLVPEPKEVQMREGGFRVSSGTRILVEFGHQAEDRIAAETLAEEILDQSPSLKVSIVGAKAGAKSESIVLARLQDPRVRRFLMSKGLKLDEAIGDEGYLLFSDKSHLVVAANTGQGLFYGVQTLRQLLRPDGKDLVCPSVTIRDWPTLQWPTIQGDISRAPNVVPDYASNVLPPH